jgi:L-lactate dehydrogenase (cytochrome)
MIIANIDAYRKLCKARLPRFPYDYISGGSYQENTLRANIAELQATLLRQRVMVDESHLNLSIRFWDQDPHGSDNGRRTHPFETRWTHPRPAA